jgi:GntR family transcriptional regulator
MTDTQGGTRLGPAVTKARDAIAALISDGVFTPHQKLPGERDLAAQVGVSRVSLRDALAVLERDGLLESSPWRGWFVRGERMAERVELTSFTEMARARGIIPTTQIQREERRPATDDEAAVLAVAADAPVLELHRLRLLDGVPACIDVSVIALGRAGGLEDAPLENASLYETLERVSGVRIVRSDYSVQAAAADTGTARLLRIDPGDPVLIGEEVAYDAAGAPVLLGRTIYRAETYRFQATLFRPATPESGA